MNSLRAVVLGAVVGLAVASVPACGPTRVVRCSTANCGGCCDETLGCLTGNEAVACGVGAVACQKCDVGQSCVEGVCRLGGIADGGATCSPSNCSGCCDSSGACNAGNLASVCGTAGAACATCEGNQTCQAGSCSDAACNGCLDAIGNCLPGNSPLSCGSDGGVCLACSFDQTCENGACVGGGCNASNCADGCCSGDTCVRGQPNDTQCGTGGAQCVGCQTPSVCQADGMCSDAGTEDGGNIDIPLDGGLPVLCGPGGLDPCTNGCCFQGITCIPFVSNFTCGANGSTCVSCGAGQSCVAGVCL